MLSVLFIYLFFFLRRDCIMGAGLNIESLFWVEEIEITLFFYQNWYFYNRRNCCTSIRCVLNQSDACWRTDCSLPRHETIVITLYETIIITLFMSLMSLCIMLPCILNERNKCPYCNVNIYANSVFTRTSFYM